MIRSTSGEANFYGAKVKCVPPFYPPGKVKKRLHGVVLTKQPTFPRHFSGRYAKNERRSGLIKPNDRRENPPRVSMANPRTKSHTYICTAPRGSNGHTLCTASHGSRQWRAATRKDAGAGHPHTTSVRPPWGRWWWGPPSTETNNRPGAEARGGCRGYLPADAGRWVYFTTFLPPTM